MKPTIEKFLKLCRGEIYVPLLSRGLSFPVRFLKTNSLDILNQREFESFSRLVEGTFYLGLLYHFLATTFPTRKNLDSVNVSELAQEWLAKSLIADIESRSYDKELRNIPSIIFESWLDSELRYEIKEIFNFNFWKKGKVFSWFKNIFFSGTSLGLLFDLASKD